MFLRKNTLDDTSKIKVRTKCDWYNHREKSTKLLSLEKNVRFTTK